jgi:hypothetical protein
MEIKITNYVIEIYCITVYNLWNKIKIAKLNKSHKIINMVY